MTHDADIAPPDLEDRPSRRISLVWLLPLLALAGALGVAWSAWSSRGPVIEIVFEDASGVRAGETTLRRRDIEVGRVEDVSFAPDADHVVVTARIEPEIAPLLDDGAQFWVVRPEITTRGVTGLGALVSGVHIETAWDDGTGEPRREFVGLPEAPLTPPNTPGLRVTLRAAEGGSVAVGAPVFFKGIDVGRIESRQLTPAGDAVEFEAFVRAPYDAHLTRATRFWNASGFDVELGAEGARLRVASLLSLLQGGVGFDTLEGARAQGAAAAASGAVFRLHPSERDARDSLLDGDVEQAALITVRFEGSVRGLSAGAPVEFRGIRIGSVRDIALSVEEGAEATLAATLQIQPRRLGVPDRRAALDFIADNARRGMRAKLQSGSLITGALYVGLVQDVQGPAKFDATAEPHPVLETAPSDLETVTATAQGMIARINALPIEALLTEATGLMSSLAAVAADPATQGLPADAAAAVQAFGRLAQSPSLAEAPVALARALDEVETLLTTLRETGAVDQLGAAVADARTAMAAASAAAASVEEATTRLPRLVSALTATADRADAVLASFEVGSELNYEAVTALREVRDAARAVTALISALDRRPNSLILGR
ncbi:intermembrane transport protein PqiB [Rubrimonas cliftonensis]|uniref:Paraquat-inducible protein B n=1 Tax=Rubrimonas cliftonensis TaxID=89524 RepID=A0A1H3WXC7_9RHOB|nr:MlaD family protein [Rubrimonas cliftonensis]SDZ91827.1 paraquat-inducible protein B [Rubrimonas cliftonensis]